MIKNKNVKVSEDISLRHLIPIDAQNIFETIDTQRNYLGIWLPFVAYTNTVKDSERFINYTLNQSPKTERVFTIRFQDTFIGIIGFKAIDDINHKAEIGYWLSQEYQGKGIMTLCVKKLCDMAFNQMQINRLQIKCATENTPSCNIPKRLKFQLEGIERQGELLSSGIYTDLNVYSLLKTDYTQ